MRKLIDPLQNHIHAKTCCEINELIIALKLHSGEVYDNQTEEQQRKIDIARINHKHPTTLDIIELLTKVHNEMNDCKIPFKQF